MGAERPAGISVTAMIFTLNEAIHLPLCLESLRDLDEVIVIDSFSRDATESIARAAGARFFQHAFTGFGDQRNWAIDHTGPRHEWILMLDADERVTPELAAELRRISESAAGDIGAFRLKRRFYFRGRWLKRSSLYPTWVVRLVRKGRVRYENRGHAETQTVEGRIGELRSDLIDENLKGGQEWQERQDRYAEREAEYEAAQAAKPLSPGEIFSADPMVRRAAAKRLAARLAFRAPLYFLYVYIFRMGFLDGPRGLRFCLMKAGYYASVEAKVREKLRR